MRDAAEATILVTGATDGLGKHVASALAARGATVLLHGRSPERLEATLEELRDQTSTEKVGSYLADLSSLAAVRDLAERILSEHDRLDVLVNNAGIIVQERKESEDGYELTFELVGVPPGVYRCRAARDGGDALLRGQTGEQTDQESRSEGTEPQVDSLLLDGVGHGRTRKGGKDEREELRAFHGRGTGRDEGARQRAEG